MIPDTRQTGRPEGWVPIGELARQAGVTKATIHHYVQMGLLPKPVKTNPRRAYYDPAWAKRIRFIKQLQEKRFMPLSAVKRLLADSGEEGLRLVDRTLLEEFGQRRRFSQEELLAAYPVGEEVFRRLVGIGLLTPREGEYCEEDARVLQAVASMREAGLDERVGFAPEELRLYVEEINRLIDREFELFNRTVLGNVPPKEVARLARVGIRFSSEILGSLHYRRLMERLEGMGQEEEKSFHDQNGGRE